MTQRFAGKRIVITGELWKGEVDRIGIEAAVATAKARRMNMPLE